MRIINVRYRQRTTAPDLGLANFVTARLGVCSDRGYREFDAQAMPDTSFESFAPCGDSRRAIQMTIQYQQHALATAEMLARGPNHSKQYKMERVTSRCRENIAYLENVMRYLDDSVTAYTESHERVMIENDPTLEELP